MECPRCGRCALVHDHGVESTPRITLRCSSCAYAREKIRQGGSFVYAYTYTAHFFEETGPKRAKMRVLALHLHRAFFRDRRRGHRRAGGLVFSPAALVENFVSASYALGLQCRAFGFLGAVRSGGSRERACVARMVEQSKPDEPLADLDEAGEKSRWASESDKKVARYK